MSSKLLFLISFLSSFVSSPSFAQDATEKHVEATALCELYTIRPTEPFWVAVQFKMDPGWHIYWKNPGDVGLGTSITWELPEGFHADDLQWPSPKRFEAHPFVSFGYDESVLLLTKIHPAAGIKAGEVVKLKAHVRWLACEAACIPGSAELALQLQVEESSKPNTMWLDKFAESLSTIPTNHSDWIVRATSKDSLLTLHLSASKNNSGELTNLAFFPSEDNLIVEAAPQVFEKTATGYRIILKKEMDSPEPNRLTGVLVAQTASRGTTSESALNIDAPIEFNTEVEDSPVETAQTSLWLVLLFAFTGGLILNLMPCVLPVLSIKILGFVKQAGEKKSMAMSHGLLFMLGVLVAFWALAGLLIILRAAGEPLGWGFQLQSPVFLIVLISVLFLFGLSMFGVFEIGISLMGKGHTLSSRSDGWGTFFSGVLATVVATPCTAPFMGCALGYAVTQPAWTSLLVFTFLGLGMAAPYVLLCSVPSFLRFVPKPGEWMISFKQFLGFLLMATVVWLLWVLGLQTNMQTISRVLITLLFLALAGWIFGRWITPIATRRTKVIASTLAISALCLGAIVALLDSNNSNASPAIAEETRSANGMTWQAYTPERLSELRRAGKPVFIDFTAAWCLSCQVNERVVFGSDEVRKKFDELGVGLLKADWTSRDQLISEALAEYGRNSVPLYVLYSNGATDKPIILPEIISPSIVLDALGKVN